MNFAQFWTADQCHLCSLLKLVSYTRLVRAILCVSKKYIKICAHECPIRGRQRLIQVYGSLDRSVVDAGLHLTKLLVAIEVSSSPQAGNLGLRSMDEG